MILPNDFNILVRLAINDNYTNFEIIGDRMMSKNYLKLFYVFIFMKILKAFGLIIYLIIIANIIIIIHNTIMNYKDNQIKVLIKIFQIINLSLTLGILFIVVIICIKKN